MLTKIKNFIFLIIIILIPFQIRFFLSGSGYIYNSAYVYLSDIFIFILFLLWISERQYQKIISLVKYRGNYFLAIFLIIVILSVFFSYNKINNRLDFWHLIKFIEFLWLFIFIKANIKGKVEVGQILIISALTQSAIAIIQFIIQSDLGLRVLGESLIKPWLAGVAKISTLDEVLIRSYGTFPHPNILAAFLLISFVFLVQLIIQRIHFKHSLKIYFLYYVLISTGVFLTFSRTAWILWVLINLIFIILNLKNPFVPKNNLEFLLLFFIIYSIALLVIFPNELYLRLNINFNEQAINQRILYSNIALKIIKDNPFLGVGLGNYINYLKDHFKGLESWQYEPVHNIFLLITSEVGIVGILVLGLFFLLKLRKEIFLNPVSLSFIFIILFFGILDHFFWTLQPGELMFWMLLGII